MRTICVVNQKGGTGKTTTAVALAHYFALTGSNVLLVDTDPQGHVAVALGLDKAPGIAHLIDQASKGQTAPLRIVKARSKLDVLPSDSSTANAKGTLTGMNFRETVLRKALDAVSDRYDLTVIDCAPSADVLHISALVAATDIVIPTRLDHLAVDGVNEVLQTIIQVRDFTGGTGLPVRGIVPTFYERRTKETTVQLTALVEAFGDKVVSPIPTDVKLRECPAYGKTIWEFAPKSRAVVGVPARSGGNTFGGYLSLAQYVEDWLR